jgi:hypothetical protein
VLVSLGPPVTKERSVTVRSAQVAKKKRRTRLKFVCPCSCAKLYVDKVDLDGA